MASSTPAQATVTPLKRDEPKDQCKNDTSLSPSLSETPNADATAEVDRPAEEPTLDLENLESMTPSTIIEKLARLRAEYSAMWHNVGHMKERIVKMKVYVEQLQAKVISSTAKLHRCREEDRAAFLQRVQHQKQLIQSLARPLQQLQSIHFDQHDKMFVEKDKKEFIMGRTRKNPNVRRILSKATQYSTIKPDHECWAPLLQARLQDFITAGIKLNQMISYETLLCNYVRNMTTRMLGASKRLKDLEYTYDFMIKECEKRKSVIQQYESMPLGSESDSSESGGGIENCVLNNCVVESCGTESGGLESLGLQSGDLEDITKQVFAGTVLDSEDNETYLKRTLSGLAEIMGRAIADKAVQRRKEREKEEEKGEGEEREKWKAKGKAKETETEGKKKENGKEREKEGGKWKGKENVKGKGKEKAAHGKVENGKDRNGKKGNGKGKEKA
ncbi:MAG: hypothetical protein Q9178_007987 [Gyalolechia marmorata]